LLTTGERSDAVTLSVRNNRIVDERRHQLRILACVSKAMRPVFARQLELLNPVIEYVAKASEIARLVSTGRTFDVAIVPAALPNAEWWALWSEMSLLNPSPAVLVYARTATFELWTGVLDLGGYDVIVEPFSDKEIQEAVVPLHKASETELKTTQHRAETVSYPACFCQR
jgi:DNA-binding NtrC family response regulator